MREQLTRSGVTPIWVDAVDAKNPTEEQRMALQELADWGPWGPVTNHAKGCTLSHFMAYRALVDSQAPFACVLEDDVFLAADLSAWLDDSSWIPERVDLVKLERWRDNRLLVMLGPPLAKYRGRSVRQLLSKHSGTGGYIISREAAGRALRAESPNVPIDQFLFHPNVSRFARVAHTLQVQPALVVQGNDPPPTKPAPVALQASSPSQPQKKSMRKSLVRAYAELHYVPTHLYHLLIRRARPERIAWLDS